VIIFIISTYVCREWIYYIDQISVQGMFIKSTYFYRRYVY